MKKMNGIGLRWAVIVAGLSALTGCSTVPHLSSTSRSVSPPPEKAVVYGRFGSHHSVLGFHFSLVLVNTESGAQSAVLMPHSSKVVAVTLAPGNYQVRYGLLEGMALSSGWGQEAKYEIDAGPFSGQFSIAAGKAYYIGDYMGRVFWDSKGTAQNKMRVTGTSSLGGGGFVSSSYLYAGEIEKCTDNYAGTTTEFRQSYPGLSNMETKSVRPDGEVKTQGP